MKKIFIFCFIFSVLNLYSSNWFEKNKKLSVVFSQEVWKYIEKANYYSDRGDFNLADLYLRKAKDKTEICEPFSPTNWPKGWPRNRDSLKYLQFATPTAYIYRIIGDFCLDRKYNKEAINYIEKYLSRCIIPDSEYYILLAEIYEKEGLFNYALNLYYEISKFIENKNYWGKDYSLKFIEGKIKKIMLSFIKPNIVILTCKFVGTPDFIKSDFMEIFENEIKKIKNINLISKNEFKKVLDEYGYIEESIEDYELSIACKTLNVDYCLRPTLAKIGESYVFGVDTFSVKRKNWFESYEYKTDNIRYLSNLIKRFVFEFQNLEIPSYLYLPENKFIWSFETDSLVTDLKMSKNGKKIIIGCESGSVYILNDKGGLIRKLSLPEKIINVSISPEGNYMAFFTLEGFIYFLSGRGSIIWKKNTGNLGRCIDISEEGRFIFYAVNRTVYYLDKNGEIFWSSDFPSIVTYIKITNDGDLTFIGTENGEFYCFRDDGNQIWKKTLNEKIVQIRNTENYVSIETENGNILIYDIKGNEILRFKYDQEIEFPTIIPEIVEILTGKNGKFLFFLSYDKKNLWKYQLKEKVSHVSSLPDGKMMIAVEGRNIFAFSINWK